LLPAELGPVGLLRCVIAAWRVGEMVKLL